MARRGVDYDGVVFSLRQANLQVTKEFEGVRDGTSVIVVRVEPPMQLEALGEIMLDGKLDLGVQLREIAVISLGPE